MNAKELNYPGRASFVPDGSLATNISLDCSGHLRAEIWLRRWLYLGQWTSPPAFMKVFSEASPAFSTAFELEAKPWRHPRADAPAPFPPDDPPKIPELTGNEPEVWKFFWRRMRDFACCDGMVALVSKGEAVAVAFKLNDQPAPEIRDAAQLERTLDALLSDPARCETLGRNARQVVDSSRGALDRNVSMILDVLQEHGIA